MDKREAVDRLQRLVVRLDQDGVDNRDRYRAWVKENVHFMMDTFAFPATRSLPSISGLVGISFHHKHPLFSFNYTSTAHNTLYKCPEAWTTPLRLCRGIVLDRSGELVALPFEKFFNRGEHPETVNLPNEPFEATDKMDGHLGINFSYRGDWLLTTRGSFQSQSSAIGQKLLDIKAKRHAWHKLGIERLTLLTEIIHPQTHVICSYGKHRRLTLIGGYDLDRLTDLRHCDLQGMAPGLGLDATNIWEGEDIKQLEALMRDLSVRNKEGFVVRFESGLRVKLKFETYLQQMRAAKLSFTYLMNRFMDGRLGEVMLGLPEEVMPEAKSMHNKLMRIRSSKRDEKAKRQALYALVPAEQSTSYYRAVCRDFLRYDAHAKRHPTMGRITDNIGEID
jgi:hypothetical protein